MQNKNFQKKKAKKQSLEELIVGIKNGSIASLSQGITLCESTNLKDRALANQLITACMGMKRESMRIGITGVPGVGKSTFIEAFGLHLIQEQKRKVAVLAVDPSSERSKGSILGDKTRMQELSMHPDAFIRPSPSSGALGGVAQATRESTILCEAAGFNIILIETVGVGQSETEVRQMSDFFLLLMLAGAGDELQGIKRGIMEMADGIVINKADGDNLNAAKRAKREYQNALHLFPAAESGWTSKVGICSALEHTRLEEVWAMLHDFHRLTIKNGYFEKNRSSQLGNWFEKSVNDLLKLQLFQASHTKSLFQSLRNEVMDGNKSPIEAAEELIKSA